jgi:hypothetical protein
VKGAQLQQVKLKLADAATIHQREQKVTEAEHDLKALMGRDWSLLLEALAEMTPKNLTWTEWKAGDEKIFLKGNSRGLIDLAQLFGGLVNDPSVDYVGLQYVDAKGITVSLTIKGKDGAVNLNGLTAADQTLSLGAFRQIDFAVQIELKPLKGGQGDGA